MIFSYHPDLDKVMAVLSKNPVDESLPEAKIVVKRSDNERHWDYDTPFSREIRAKADEYFRRVGEPRRGGLLFKTLVLLGLVATAYTVALTGSSFFVRTAAALTMGVLIAIVGLAIQHDANHGAFSDNPTLNWFFGLTDEFIGGSALIWRHKHTVSHHVHCNDTEHDDDTSAALPFVRFHGNSPHEWYMKYQPYYVWLLYAQLGMTQQIFDTMAFVKGTVGSVRLLDISQADRIQFWVCRALYVIVYLLVPRVVLGSWSGVAQFYVPLQLAGSLYLASLFAVSHNNELCEDDVHDTNDWAASQCRTSANWATKSTLWNYASGGLNAQIEHHLFPGVAHRHYPALSREVVKPTCEKFGVPYNDFPTFREILWSHFITLCKLADPNTKGKVVAPRPFPSKKVK
jgi:linoleoyl-CoA desaturase